MRHDHRNTTRHPTPNKTERSFAFRRSRTITGSAAGNVRAASETRGQLQSSRLHEHSLRSHRQKLLLYLLATVSVAGALWYVIASYVNGESVTTGTKSTQTLVRPLDQARYQSIVRAYLRDRPFEHFAFALNNAHFNEYMRRQAPEVKSADLSAGSGFGTAFLALELREPVVTWTIKGQQYYVDPTGTAFTDNYFATPTVVVSDKSGISADAGVVTSNRLLRFIGRVITLINTSDIPQVQHVELPADSTRQVDFKLQDKAFTIKAHLDRDPAGQAADIISAVRYVETKGIQPSYLDVRVSSKAYYRDTQ